MTDQHERVGRVLDQVDEELRRWAHDAGPISRKQRRLIMLGHTLEDADSGERSRFLLALGETGTGGCAASPMAPGCGSSTGPRSPSHNRPARPPPDT